MIKKRIRFLDFEEEGPVCIHCRGSIIYTGCNKHENLYPIITDKNKIRIPNCELCRAECGDCAYSGIVSSYYSDILESRKRKKKSKKKRRIKTTKEKKPELTFSKADLLTQIDLSGIDKVDVFKNSIISIFDIIFAIDIGSQLGINSVATRLGKSGITIDSSYMESSLDKLLNLLFTMMTIRSTGLSTYEEPIMESEIKRMYAGREMKQSDITLFKKLLKGK